MGWPGGKGTVGVKMRRKGKRVGSKRQSQENLAEGRTDRRVAGAKIVVAHDHLRRV